MPGLRKPSEIKRNQTQSMDRVQLSSAIEQNRTTFSVSSIFEPIELNRTNWTQSNSVQWIMFDWV